MWIIGRSALLVVGILLVNFALAIRQGEFAMPMSVTLKDFAKVQPPAFACARCTSDPIKRHWFAQIDRGTGSAHAAVSWNSHRSFWTDSPNAGGVLRIDIGAESFLVPVSKLQTDGTNDWLPDYVVIGNPPGFAMRRNWPGMRAFLTYYSGPHGAGADHPSFFALIMAIGGGDPDSAATFDLFSDCKKCRRRGNPWPLYLVPRGTWPAGWC